MIRFRLAILAPSVMVSLFLAFGTARADNWPNWRGPTYDGISLETGIPSEWGPEKNLAWQLPLPGMGSSTPVVWEDRIFLTCEDDTRLVLMCVGANGKELWRRQVGSGKKRARGDEGNEASPSPSTDGKHVYALVGSGELACFTMDGKEVWKFNLQDRFGKFKYQFGMHSTPLLFSKALFIQLIHSNAASVAAINKETGDSIWEVPRPSDGRDECEQSYASIALWQKGKDGFVIAHGNDYTTAHRIRDGEEIWRVGDLNPKDKYNNTLRFVASPVASPELIVVPTAKNGPVVGVRPIAKGTITTGSRFERWRRPANTPDVPSPLINNGFVYLCREDGRLICLDAELGEEKYHQRTHTARYRASPVYADGKIYLTARDGVFTVVQAGPEFKVLATNKLPDDFTASPAISNGRIYLRGFKTLYAIGKP